MTNPADEIIELAKIAALVNGEMTNIASKTDPDGRQYIPIRKIDPRQIIRAHGGTAQNGPTVESIPVDTRELPAHLRPVPLENLLIPDGSPDTTSQRKVQGSPVKVEPVTNSPQLELGLSFHDEPTSTKLEKEFFNINRRLDRLENKINLLLERKSKRQKVVNCEN